jgi:CHAT domain-containing protein
VGPVTEQSEHLSSAQIENYGNRTSGAGPEAAQRDEHQRANHQSSDDKSLFDQQSDQQITDQSATDQRVEAHLADCASCRNRVLDFHRHRFALLSGPAPDAKPTDSALADSNSANPKYPADPQVRTAATPECPSDDALRQLAAGLTPDDAAPELIRHAATCDHCGPLLRTCTEIFSDDFTPEEQAALANLQGSSAAWQKNTARQMLQAASMSAAGDANAAVATAAEAAGSSTTGTVKPDEKSSAGRQVSPAPVRKPFFWKWALVPATTAVCAVAVLICGVVGFGVWYARRDTPQKAEGLLAQAYTEQRTIELRWPGAKWGPVRTERGPEESRFAKPKSLLKAEGMIGDHDASNPANIAWLRAKAQADILDRNPEAAIAGLNKALEAQPDSVPLMIDLGLAYDLQAEVSGDPRNFGQAIDFFGKALKKEPSNREALFNRALLYGQTGLIDSAIADWETFLENETDPLWKDEAQKKLDTLRKSKRKQSSVVLPQSLNEWDAVLNSGDPTAAESVLDKAVVEWLSPLNGSLVQARPASVELLVTTAQKLESQHQDRWLTDLLRARYSPHFDMAISALLSAVLLNLEDKASDAIIPARQAQVYFLRDHNLPGLARAQLEEVYAYQRLPDGTLCLNSALPLRQQIETAGYSWIQTQLLLDEASCFNILGRLEESKLDVDDALALAKKSNYKILSLRALAIGASLATTRGDSSFAVKRDLEGLQEYWSGQYPIVRAYQFYSDLSFNAEAAELSHLAYATDAEAVWAISQTPKKRVEAIARYRLAKAAVMIGNSDSATREMGLAERLVAQLPRTESTFVAQVDGIIGVIRAEINLGNYDAASDRLKQINVPPEFTDSKLIARRLDLVRGDIALKLGRLREAQEAYLAAVAIAESSLSTLRDDRDRLRWSQENGPSYRALADVAQKQGDPVAALEIWELYRAAPIRKDDSAGLRSAGAPQSYLSLSDLRNNGIVSYSRSRIRAETLISYAFLPTGLGIWVLVDNQVEFTLVDTNPKEVQRLARQFTDECSNPQSDLEALRQHGNRLYKLLIGPASAHIKPGDVFAFETDGELDGLPFAALVDDSGKYLVESYAMLFSPGLAYQHYLRQPEPIRRTDRALIVGDPVVSQKWRRVLPPLPSANREAATVAANFSDPTLLPGKAATMQRLRQELPNINVFHFAGHSVQTRLGPAILLAASAQEDDDILAISDFPAESLRNAKLIVLSACGTKIQRTRPELYFRPFISSRVPEVLVTLWQIDSTATLTFMNEFYRRTWDAHGRVDSIAAAARIVQHQKSYSHPYFWASFVLNGRI